MEVTPRNFVFYETIDGRFPFVGWLESLRDRRAKNKIKRRLDQVELGNLGDCKSIGDGVFELRIDHGPGYRVYLGHSNLTVVLLLCGGNKATQQKDILKAKEYWADYESNKNTGK